MITACPLEGVVKVLVSGLEETLEIDAERGPRVYQGNGQMGYFELRNYRSGAPHAVQVPEKKWRDLTSTERKVMMHLAAKKNQSMRSWAGPSPEALRAEAEAREVREAELRAAEAEALSKLAGRCEAERARPPIYWRPISFDQVTSGHSRRAPGVFYGLDFPWTAQLLEEFGPDWLTTALHKAGTLEQTNRVTKIIIDDRIKVTAGNNAGKFLFEVRYERERAGLHTKLFAKVPFPLTRETKQDRLSSSVLKQPMDFYEINTYRLAETLLPVQTPKFYFGDISNDTSNYILILERVPFVEMDGKARNRALRPFEIEGPYDKCKDFQLRGPERDYYTLIMQASAKIAGADKSGAMGSREFVDSSFGRPPVSADMPELWGVNPHGPSGGAPTETMAKLRVAVQFFSETAKVVFPTFVTSEQFINKFTETMMTLAAYTREIEYWKHKNPDYVALGHANLNVDNAYFWRDESGMLDCGVLDWGGFGAGCLGHKVWWYLNCAEFEQLKENLGHYIEAFASTYQSCGGPALDLGVMDQMVKLTCLSNLAFMVAAVPDCLRQCPKQEWETIKNRHDPRIASNIGGKSTLRTTLRVMDNGLRMIEELGADKVLQTWIDEVWVRTMGQSPKTREMIFGPAE